MSDATVLPTDLLRPGQAGKLVGKSPSAIVRWVLSGRVPGWKIGGQLHVSRADIMGQVEPVTPKGGRERPMPQLSVQTMRAETRRTLERFGMLKKEGP